MNRSPVKELFSHTMIYGVGIMLNKSVNFILLPVYTKYFTPEQVGMLTLILSLSFFLGIIYTFGLETAFMKFFIDAKDIMSKAEIYSSILIFLTLTSIIISMIVYIFSSNIIDLIGFENSSESNLLLQILCIVMFLDTLYRFPLLLFRAELNTKTYAVVNLVSFIINLTGNIILIIFFGMGVEAVLICYIISTLSTLIIGLILTKKHLLLKISYGLIKQLLTFGNKFIYIGLFLILIDVSDRFFLKYYFNESIVGIYSANYRLASVMGFMIAAFKFSWTPYFMNLSSHPDNKKIIATIFTYFIFSGLFLFLIFSIFMDHLVQISFFGLNLLDINYWQGLNIIPMVLLAYFFSGIYSLLNAAPFFTDNTGSLFAFALSGLIINMLFNFLLIPFMGMKGAALATMVTYALMSVIIYIYSQKIYKIEYEWNTILKLAVVSILVFVAGYFFVNRMKLDEYLIIGIDILLILVFLATINYFKIIDLRKVKMLWKK
ncbi:MAG: oligosaccharide flippase family protein [Ignavibacteria bacterium]